MCTDDVACCLFDTRLQKKLSTTDSIPDHPESSAVALARFYGFLRHQRVYACAIDGEPLEPLQPSWIENLLGDG